MPKRKATTQLSGLTGSENEDVMPSGADHAQKNDERPAKKPRGRPRSKSAEMKAAAEAQAPAPQEAEPATRRGTRRGRPKGGRNSGQMAQEAENKEEPARPDQDTAAQETDGGEASAPENAAQTAKPTRATKGGATRGRKKASAAKQFETDGEFQFTPTGTRQQKTVEEPEKKAEPAGQKRRKSVTLANEEPETVQAEQEVEETMIREEAPETASTSPAKRRQSVHASLSSPSKRKSVAEDGKGGSEPELRRRLGDLTRKYDTLESRYRNLKEIGVIEANANMEKLKKQCESMTTGKLKLAPGYRSGVLMYSV